MRHHQIRTAANKIEYHFVDQGSEQWHQGREGKYTGSNAYKLLGSFGASEYAKAVKSNFKGNFWTKRGHLLEDEAIDLYQQIFESVGIRNEDGKRVGYVANSDYPICIYSPDDIYPDSLIEVKCFDLPQHKKLLDGDINIKILAQIHYGMLITGRKKAELIAYNPHAELSVKNQFKVIRIPHNRNIADNFKRILLNEPRY